MEIRPEADDRSRIGRALLARLPAWFGRPEAVEHYVSRMDALPVHVAWEDARAVGFAALVDHNPHSTEIFVMAVDPDRHRQGIGRGLVAAAVEHVRRRGASVLFVRTLGPSDPSRDYAATRRFYHAVGFLPVEETKDFWGPGTPSLLLARFVAPKG